MVWTKHYQHGWEETSGDHRLPDWFRVTAAAYGLHRANGHACFGPGKLAWILYRLDPDTGEMKRGRNVHRAIYAAVEFGLLDERSSPRCLVVPQHRIHGPHGNARTPCPVHGEV